MTKEALKLALEALEAAYARIVTKCEQNLVTYNGVDVDTLTLSQEAITVIKEALAQPERSMKVEGPLHVVCQCNKCNTQPKQEPVAWITKTGNVWKTKADETDTPLYTKEQL